MQIIKFISLVIVLTLTIFLNVSKAQESTTGNLLPNAGDGQSPYQNTTDSHTPDKVGSGSGFTIDSGIQAFTNELEAKGTGTISANGSLVGIASEKENGGQFNITADSLDGGLTLNSLTEVQNCEWAGSSSQCGQATAGQDSYSTQLKILDGEGNLLVSVNQNRNNDAGYYGNTYTYSDTITHTGTGARNWDWQWTGVDGNDTNSTGSVGPNLLGASLTATLLDIDYEVLSQNQQEEISLATGNLETSIEEINFESFENINVEPIKIERFNLEPPKIEEIQIEKIEIEEFKVKFEQNFREILVKENLVKEFETALFEENLTQETFFEETTNMIMEELKPPKEEISALKEPELKRENTPTKELKEENPKELKKEETNAITEKPGTKTVKTEETLSTNEETTEPEGQESEVVSNEPELVEDKETKGQEETEGNGEIVEDETNVSVEDRKITTTDADNISKKIQKVIAKINSKLKRVDQKLQATSLVLSVGMSANAPDLTVYKNKRLNGGTIPDGNLELFEKLNILEQQQIYKEASLNAYTSNDPIAVQQNALARVSTRINTLKAEIAALKSIQ
tara:strand:+ start:39 stop:1751 length:1713 start_codon:yes stop_codon:yes gene_type:complete